MNNIYQKMLELTQKKHIEKVNSPVYFYILELEDGNYYIGQSKDLITLRASQR